MHYEHVGSSVLLIDTIRKFYSNCGPRDCIRSPTIYVTPKISGGRELITRYDAFVSRSVYSG